MKTAQIVLIEDNPADVLLVRMAIDGNGIPYSLTQFKDGLEALRVLCGPVNGDTPRPDAILMDLNTPRSDGFETLERLRDFEALSQVPIAILTSSGAPDDRRRAVEAGARYVQKPSQLQGFLDSVGGAVKDMLSESARLQDQSDAAVDHAAV